MKTSAPLPPRPTLSRKLAGSAALLISIGIVLLVASRAGLVGCVSSAEISAESASADPAGASGYTFTPAPEDDPHFMGGSKAPAGGWAFPSKPRATEAPAQTASPKPPQQPASPPPSQAPQTPPQAPPQTAH